MYDVINLKSEHLTTNCKYLTVHEKYALHIYLDYLNNYLSVTTMSDHTGLNVRTLNALINNGKAIHTILTK